MDKYQEAILTTYERNVASGKKKTKAVKVVEDMAIKKMLKGYLTTEIVINDEDDESKQYMITPMELITLNMIGNLREKCSVKDYKELMEILGEHVDRKDVNVSLSLVDQDLRNRALD